MNSRFCHDCPVNSHDRHVPAVSATINPTYYAFYIEGLRRRFGGVRWTKPTLSLTTPGMAFTAAGRRVYICAEDDADINDEAYAWCDVYGKINARRPLPDKVVPIGPSFGCQAWTPARSAAVAAQLLWNRTRTPPRLVARDLARQALRRRPEAELVPGTADPSYVFFVSNIWQKEPDTNEGRAAYMRQVMARPELTFEGGFAPRSDGNTHGFDDLIMETRVPYATYLDNIKRSAFVFNTPAVLGCHGWKLAEFLAMGKAIISTPLSNEMPAPFEPGRHYVETDGSPQSTSSAIDALMDPEFRRSLEVAAREYYDRHLTPTAVIDRLVSP